IHEASGDFTRAAVVSSQLAWIHFWKVDPQRGLSRLRRALGQLRSADRAPGWQIEFLGALMGSVRGSGAEGVATFERALSIQKEVPGADLRAIVARVEAHLFLHIGDLTRSALASQEGQAIFEAAGDLWNKVDISIFPGIKSLFCGQPAEG